MKTPDVMDREANEFAMALLMPEAMVRAELRRHRSFCLTDDLAVKELAKKFQVPVAIMVIRLEQLR